MTFLLALDKDLAPSLLDLLPHSIFNEFNLIPSGNLIMEGGPRYLPIPKQILT